MKTSRLLLPLLATFALDTTLPAQEQEKDRPLQLQPEEREVPRKKERPDADHKERFARMKQEIEDLRSAGNHEEAEKRMRQMREQLEREHRSQGKEKGGEEGPAKIRHVMEAVRHLRAAGLKEPAENLEQHARRMREEFEQQQQNREKQPDGDRGSIPVQEFRELRMQVEKLTRELEKVREELKTHQGEEKP